MNIRVAATGLGIASFFSVATPVEASIVEASAFFAGEYCKKLESGWERRAALRESFLSVMHFYPAAFRTNTFAQQAADYAQLSCPHLINRESKIEEPSQPNSLQQTLPNIFENIQPRPSAPRTLYSNPPSL